MSPDLTQLLFDESPDALIGLSGDGTVLFWNRGAEGTFGYAAEEAIGKSIYALVVPEDRAQAESQLLQRATEKGLSAYESLRRSKKGSLVHVDVSAKAIRDGTGELVCILATEKDVTQFKSRRDGKLVEAKFSDLLELTPDAIIMASPTGRIVLANSQAEKLFGYQPGELRGQLVEVLLPARYHGGHVAHRSNYFAQPRTRAMGDGMELFGVRKDGVEFPVEISLSPLKTDEGALVMSAIRDITGRKRIERALHEKNLELRQAAEAKNLFLANMSHELRTPLNGIIGFAEFLSDGKPGPLNAKQKEYLLDILNSGKHLLQLINDVLDLAKVEAGRMDLSPETFLLRTAVDEVRAVANPIAQKKEIRVSAEIAPKLDRTRLDQQKFKQVLYNLLSNAIKFTDDGGAVEIILVPHGSHQFKLSVRDTGIGIRPEDIPRLFTEFEQLESGASRRYEGTGLGLALTRKLVELQGGVITVKSEVGKGSTFSVVLPLDGGKGNS